MDADEVFPASQPAREARRMLVTALQLLQAPTGGAVSDRVLEHTAAASSALYEVEAAGADQQAASNAVRVAIEQLGHALAALQTHGVTDPTVAECTETVARTLALLYPVARALQRRRKDVLVPRGSLPPPEVGGDRLSAPPAPPPAGRPRTATAPYVGPDHRESSAHRVFLEVDIGLASESNFYTGLSQDLSTGGLFVATYDPKPPGTPVALYFALPGAPTIQAQGVVKWTRPALPDAPPGMGVAFTGLEPADAEAIRRFCEHRSPLYHDTDDE